jgi:hypothetical protein
MLRFEPSRATRVVVSLLVGLVALSSMIMIGMRSRSRSCAWFHALLWMHFTAEKRNAHRFNCTNDSVTGFRPWRTRDPEEPSLRFTNWRNQ